MCLHFIAFWTKIIWNNPIWRWTWLMDAEPNAHNSAKNKQVKWILWSNPKKKHRMKILLLFFHTINLAILFARPSKCKCCIHLKWITISTIQTPFCSGNRTRKKNNKKKIIVNESDRGSFNLSHFCIAVTKHIPRQLSMGMGNKKKWIH